MNRKIAPETQAFLDASMLVSFNRETNPQKRFGLFVAAFEAQPRGRGLPPRPLTEEEMAASAAQTLREIEPIVQASRTNKQLTADEKHVAKCMGLDEAVVLQAKRSLPPSAVALTDAERRVARAMGLSDQQAFEARRFPTR